MKEICRKYNHNGIYICIRKKLTKTFSRFREQKQLLFFNNKRKLEKNINIKNCAQRRKCSISRLITEGLVWMIFKRILFYKGCGFS